MKIQYLICYDISDDFRWSKIFRLMKGKGTHLQYSVFYCFLNQKELAKIINEVRRMIDLKQDDVRIYPLLANFKCIVLGRGDRTPEGVDLFWE